ncbi:MAG: tRNA pseudouridine(55) synthase TruB [Gammaproteobacteria bacterium]|nr:tRNA pseudouridine(55) synthase TruB [Gammaproteobacteria bacterium]MCP5138577.1 tRNA pseudouridine(55) synthase TruB [Chromatiales bacterium]
MRSGGARPPGVRRKVDGLLLLDKPSGVTSNAALQKLKWLYAARKAGHTGSLDPLASGMLPLCFGEATKFSQYLLGADKTYLVRARFGARTDTADSDGTVVESTEVRIPDEATLRRAVQHLTGSIAQVPPMYSALKHQGQRLYELARAGREVERPARPVVIYSFEIEHFDPVAPVFRVRCSKGTYIRVLIEDVAKEIGSLAHVIELRRTSVGGFEEAAMLTVEQCMVAADEGTKALDALLLPLDEVAGQWPLVRLQTEEARLLLRGSQIAAPNGQSTGMVRLYTEGGSFFGMGEVMTDGRLLPRRLLAHGSAARDGDLSLTQLSL